MDNYDVIIGVEIHAELNTESKIFCSCRNEFGHTPNTLVCPVCLGLPGSLPVLNKSAVEKIILTGISLGCKINKFAVMERKNYFYPDLPKSYQISQYSEPICIGGGIALSNGKYIRFNRIHLEEDAGKLVHSEDRTLVDFNRSGVPLIEMVTEPDFSSSEEVVEFINKLKEILIYLNVSNCKMEQGELRFDINISVKKKRNKLLGTRVELKNLNSFKSIINAINYEKYRQTRTLDLKGEIEQETRGWDEDTCETYIMRTKEEVNDYRYFPDPDLLAVEIKREDVQRIKASMPELADSRRKKYKKLGLSDNDINVLLSEKLVSDYYDELVIKTNLPKETANWMLTDLMGIYNKTSKSDLKQLISVSDMAKIIKLTQKNSITRVNAKILLEQAINTGKPVDTLLKELDLRGNVTKKDIIDLIDEVARLYPGIREDYRKDKQAIINFFIGNIVEFTKGKAKIEKILPIIRDKLDSM